MFIFKIFVFIGICLATNLFDVPDIPHIKTNIGMFLGYKEYHRGLHQSFTSASESVPKVWKFYQECQDPNSSSYPVFDEASYNEANYYELLDLVQHNSTKLEHWLFNRPFQISWFDVFMNAIRENQPRILKSIMDIHSNSVEPFLTDTVAAQGYGIHSDSVEPFLTDTLAAQGYDLMITGKSVEMLRIMDARLFRYSRKALIISLNAFDDPDYVRSVIEIESYTRKLRGRFLVRFAIQHDLDYVVPQILSAGIDLDLESLLNLFENKREMFNVYIQNFNDDRFLSRNGVGTQLLYHLSRNNHTESIQLIISSYPNCIRYILTTNEITLNTNMVIQMLSFFPPNHIPNPYFLFNALSVDDLRRMQQCPGGNETFAKFNFPVEQKIRDRTYDSPFHRPPAKNWKQQLLPYSIFFCLFFITSLCVAIYDCRQSASKVPLSEEPFEQLAENPYHNGL